MELPDDPFVLELLPEFIATWIKDIKSKMIQLAQEKNEDDLYRFGHTIKGSCFQFGLPHIAAFGIELMGYARSHDWDAAIAMEPRVIDALEISRQFVKDNLQEF